MDRTVNINSSRTCPGHRQRRFHFDPVGKLSAHQQKKARFIGLSLAMLLRILLLLSITWVIGLTRPLFNIANFQVTGRAMILVAGGLFLLVKSTHEIHDQIEGEDECREARAVAILFAVLVQISLFRDGVLAVCGNAQLENAIPKTRAARGTEPATAEGDPSHRNATLKFMTP